MFTRNKSRRNSYRTQAVRADHFHPNARRQRRRGWGFAPTTLLITGISVAAILGLRYWANTTNPSQPAAEVEESVLRQTAPAPESATSAHASLVPTAKQKRPNLELVQTTQPMSRQHVRELLTPFVEQQAYPRTIHHPEIANQAIHIDYTLDDSLQIWAEKRLKHYQPDYGVFVALEPDSGKILALASNRRGEALYHNLATKATYPAASTIKLITAAAAIEEGKATPNTVYAFNGKSTSLYKTQVFEPKDNKWTRRLSLEQAFAKSVNPIFGRIGAQTLGGQTLLKYAEQFGFNAQFMTDFEFDNGSITLDIADRWQTAESASGYTRRNTLSPIHGAALAASVINGGYLIAPTLVNSISASDSNTPLYAAKEPRKIKVLSDESTESLKTLMAATVKSGTGRKIFRRFFKNEYQDLHIGGKTGHLSGSNPKGSYDWFIGYGEKDIAGETKQIAFAMLCINIDKWYVKSGQFAREALEYYFKDHPQAVSLQSVSPSNEGSG